MVLPIIITIAVLLGIFLLARLISHVLVVHFLFDDSSVVQGPKNQLDRLFVESHGRLIAVQVARLGAETALKTAGPPKPALLICHGQGESVGMWAPAQEYLASLGYASLVFDYSGFGTSSPSHRISHLAADTAAVAGYLNELFPQQQHFALVGFSLGAAAVIHSGLATSPLFSTVILCEAFQSIREFAISFGMIPRPLAWIMPNHLNNRDRLAQLPATSHLFHSRDDEITPFSHALALHQAAPDLQFHELTGFAHNDLWRNPSGGYWNALVQVLQTP